MPTRRDPSTLYDQGDGTYNDEEKNVYNRNGFLIKESEQHVATQQLSYEENQRIMQEGKKRFDDAVEKAGGLFHMPGIHLDLGLGGLIFIGFLLAGVVSGFSLFLQSNDGKILLRNIGDFFDSLFFHIGAFLFAWPQTMMELFEHWFYPLELLLGVFLVYHLVKTASDTDLQKEDILFCMLPYMLIEGIRAIFRNKNDMSFTGLACILRGLGLGLVLCIIVRLVKKVLRR